MVPERSVGPISFARLAFLVFVVVVAQLVASQHLRVFGVAVDLFLVVAALAGLAGGAHFGAWFGFFVGIAADAFFRNTPFGLSALELSVIGYSTGMLRSALIHSSAFIGPMVVYCASLGGLLILLASSYLFGLGNLFQDGWISLFLVYPVLNALAALIFTPLMRWAMPENQTQLSLVH